MIKKTFASLFTGGGLADIGAMAAGYELLWGVELCPDIAAVANANLTHRDAVHTASVIGFDWFKVERPDHLHMSPPCQDYSVAKTIGKVGNDNDAIANACIEALSALQPSTVTLENVEGYRKAKGFQRIVDWLWGAGYWVNVDVLNSADFGVPQTRRRLMLRAVRGGFPGPLPEPVKWRGWYEAIEDLIPDLPETQFAAWQLKRLPDELKQTCYIEDQNSSRDATIRGIDSPVPTVIAGALRRPVSSPKAYVVHSNNQQAMTTRGKTEPLFTVMTNSGDRVANLPKAYLIESKNANQQYGDEIRHQDEPHTAVITDHKPSHQPKVFILGQGTYSDPIEATLPSQTITSNSNQTGARVSTPTGRVVRMTPRCLARFQSVPDSYVLPEKRALACKIIGNGIPCLMMQRVLESLN